MVPAHGQHHNDDGGRLPYSWPAEKHEGEVHEQRVQKWKQLGGQKGLEGKGVQRKIRFQLSASHSFGLVLGHGSHLCFRPTGD